MQEYRKLLCVNKIRETKRLIENMLIPILSLVVAAAVVGYQIVINFFPIIRKINACNLRICYLVFGFLILYSFGVCFINVKPAIIIKPASLFFIQEKRIRQMISIKYIGLTLKDIIFSIILSACINGIHLNRNFLFILLIIFLLLNTTNLMRWKIYHANQRRDIGIWLLVSNHQFNWWFIISPPKGYCYCSPQRAVSQALLLARYKAVLLESSRLDSSACSFIYF